MQMELSAYTALGDRVENEDTGAYDKMGADGFFAVVCDGLGAHGGGKTASRTAAEALSRGKATKDLPTAGQITAWMNDANAEILRKREGPSHMKTTAVALYVRGTGAIWAHIGDSRLYHYYNGELADFTQDHSVCQTLVKVGEITRRDIPGHPDRSKVLRVIGEENIRPEVHPQIELQPGFHAFLLCSDGLWERLQEDEIMIELHKAPNPEQWLLGLRTRALMRKNTDVDNNTAVAAYITV